MLNRFSETYKKLPTSKLLDIIENRKDYQSIAIEAAKLELASRQDIEAAKNELKEKNIQIQKKTEADNQKRQIIKDKASKVFEFVDPLVEKTPSKSISIICLLLLLIFIFRIVTDFSLLISLFHNISEWDFFTFLFVFELIFLPITIYLLWKRTKAGWTMTVIWFGYKFILNFGTMFLLASVPHIDGPIEGIFPTPNLYTYFFILLFNGSLLYFMFRRNTREIFNKMQKDTDTVMSDL